MFYQKVFPTKISYCVPSFLCLIATSENDKNPLGYFLTRYYLPSFAYFSIKNSPRIRNDVTKFNLLCFLPSLSCLPFCNVTFKSRIRLLSKVVKLAKIRKYDDVISPSSMYSNWSTSEIYLFYKLKWIVSNFKNWRHFGITY